MLGGDWDPPPFAVRSTLMRRRIEPDPLESERTLPVPPDDHPLRVRAQENLADRAGIDDALARELLDAAVRAAEAEVLTALAEEQPVPSSMADTRAYRLHAISNLLGRTPETYEVSAIFRVPETTARSIVTRMEATYPSLRARGIQAAIVETSGPPRLWQAPGERRGRYEVEYADPRGREALRARLRRLGVTNVREGSNQRSVAFPQRTASGENVLDLLGLPRPEDDPNA